MKLSKEDLIAIRKEITLLERREWELRNFQGEPPETVFISKVVEAIEKSLKKRICWAKTVNVRDWYRIKDIVDTLKLNNREANRIIKLLLKIYPEVVAKNDLKSLMVKNYSELICRREKGFYFYICPWMINKWKRIYCE